MFERTNGVRIRVVTCGWIAVLATTALAAEKRVDNPVDAWMTAAKGAAGSPVVATYARRPEILDTTDAKQGDFSIVFTVGDPAKEEAFGFATGPFLDRWTVAKDGSLHVRLKAVAEPPAAKWGLVVHDTAGKRAVAELPGMAADGQWREFTVPLASMKAEQAPDFSALRAVQIEADLPKDARLWLDDVYFKAGDTEVGVSDKTVTQYMAESAATLPKRIEAARVQGQSVTPGQREVAALWNGRDVEKANEQLIEWFRKEKAAQNVSGNWNLATTTSLNWLYFGFSSKGRLKAGGLTPECEKELLDLYWKHCELNNDIAIARHSSWWVTGSENHDVNFKVANLLSSQIFMNHPDYAKRVYPDLGLMHGYGYGGGYLMQEGRVKPYGRGAYKDGKEYTAADHYEAWVKFWKEWFVERARHGFFVEHNATGYMKHTNKFLHDIYAWCDDEELRRECRMFMDLVWAQWAQDQLLTCSGGAGTRVKGNGYHSMSDLSIFLLGGPGNGGEGFFQVFSDYQWPRAVWELMLDRRGKGEYAFLSRKPNEEQDIWPQPPGTEYTMLIRPDSRLARSSWVTPDYVLGVRMDHPAAMYTHISLSRNGMIFATKPNAYIAWSGWDRAVQHRNLVVFQQNRNFLSRSPAWFMGWTVTPGPASVEIGPGVGQVVEKDGWVFVEEGNAFAAIRMISAAQPAGNAQLPVDEEGFDLLSPVPDSHVPESVGAGRALKSKENFPVVIVEASRRERHPTLEAFQKDILDNPLKLRKTIGSFLLEYRGCGDDGPVVEFNGGNDDIPTIDGQHIDYECPTFESPFLQGAAGGGVVTINAPISGKKLVLDFNAIERREE